MIDPKSLRIGNTLIKEMEEAIQRCPMTQSQASSCASVAMKWIEKAFEAGTRMGMDEFNPPLKEWLELNGLTPTEPDTKEPKQ